MDQTVINAYGDKRVLAGDGRHGVDVASQRADNLDLMALEDIWKRIAGGTIPSTADLGCGSGGQVARMAATGAHVLGMDISDQASAIAEAAPAATFLQMDLEALATMRPAVPGAPFDVVVCQRTIHYLPHQMACAVLTALHDHYMGPEATLYISASGIGSELADGYACAKAPVHRRYAELGSAMQEKHGIFGPVCLYSEFDLAELVAAVGFRVIDVSVSPFGNAKVAAVRRRP